MRGQIALAFVAVTLAMACGGGTTNKYSLDTKSPTPAPAVRLSETATAIPSPTPPTVTAVATQAVTTVVPAVAQNDVLGARLGGTRAAWISANGSPVKTGLYDRFGTTEVTWQREQDGTERAMTLEILYPGKGVTVASARSDSTALMPADSRSVSTYIARAGQTVEVFFTESLAAAVSRLKPDVRASLATEGDPEGTFIRIAERGSPTTSRLLLAVGNNP
jgi:hypothetical protein